MQIYVAEPSDKLDGTYCVSVWNAISNQYEVIERNLLSEYEAKEKACQLNEQYERENYEFEHQNELIDKYHDYAVSGEIQKQNAAREFFKSFPYQRETCEQILKQLEYDIVCRYERVHMIQAYFSMYKTQFTKDIVDYWD